MYTGCERALVVSFLCFNKFFALAQWKCSTMFSYCGSVMCFFAYFVWIEWRIRCLHYTFVFIFFSLFHSIYEHKSHWSGRNTSIDIKTKRSTQDTSICRQFAIRFVRNECRQVLHRYTRHQHFSSFSLLCQMCIC